MRRAVSLWGMRWPRGANEMGNWWVIVGTGKHWHEPAGYRDQTMCGTTMTFQGQQTRRLAEEAGLSPCRRCYPPETRGER